MSTSNNYFRNLLGGVLLAITVFGPASRTAGQTWTNALDDQADYSNQDPTVETRRSAHFRIVFGHKNWDPYGWTEQMAQGNLQEYEQFHNRWVNDLGLWDCGQSYNTNSATNYRFNMEILMTFSLQAGGGSYNSEDSAGFFYTMDQPADDRYDPMSGAVPHEIGDAWCGYGKGIVGNAWGNLWECTGNWMMLQALSVYPTAYDYEQNGMYSPLNGRDYFGSWPILEMAMQAPGFGSPWVCNLYTNATPSQRTSEYWIARMQRIPNTTGQVDATNAVNDLWGNLAKRLVTWDFQKQIWLSAVNGFIGGGPTLPNLGYGADSGADWVSYQRSRTTLLAMPGTNGWYRCAYEDAPQQFGWNIIPLAATPGATVTCNFQPVCDPIRQSGWRACLVAVSTNVVSLGQGNTNGYASYSALWSCGVNSITLSADQTKLYLVVVATPAPQGIYGSGNTWNAYITEAGLQFPYAMSFSNAAPLNVVYAQTNGYAWKSYTNADGTVCPHIASTATVTAPAYVGSNSMVLDSATVSGHAQLLDYAVVGGSAQVYGNAIISGHGLVANNAQVYGFGKVRDWADVYGYAQVYGYGKVIEHGNCGDGNATAYSTVSGSAVIKGTTYDYPGTYIAGGVIMDGESADGGDEPVVHTNGVHFGWGWPGIGTPFNIFSNTNNYQYCGLTFETTPNSNSSTESAFTNLNGCLATDEFGINHGFLMNGCRQTIDSGGTTNRGGYVLALNGTNQYVELRNSVNDFNDTTIAVWFKSTGGASGQRVWSMGNGSNKVMYLTPNDSTTGNLRFLIADGNTTNTLNGGVVPTNVWTHVAVVFAQATSNSVLYVNGLPVATNSAITLFPDSLNAPLMANANYLGRGYGGNYFQGSVDDFRVFMRSFAASDVATLYAKPAPAVLSPVTDSTLSTPAWLAQPYALGDSSITMSVVPGTDTSGWVQYYFSNNTVLGHDSGWVSFNNYTDCGLTPSTAYTYTVWMRNQNGVTTAASTAQSATTPTSIISSGAASFAYGPVGYANGQITMTAAVVTNASGKTEYSFACTAGGGHSSGWIASPSWTDSGLTTGGSYSYTVTVRDGRGHTSAASAAVPAKAEDDAAPQLYSNPLFQWSMTPYPTISNSISMTAKVPGDPSGVQYYFHCTSSNAPDSGWQTNATYVTPVLTNGTYGFVYMLRDQSAQTNQSGYCAATYPAVITPSTGYQPCTFAQLATLANDNLVSFTGMVTAVTINSYTVRDPNGTNTVTVGTTNFASATTSGLIFNTVSVSGHLYTFTNVPVRSVTFSIVNSIGTPTNSISGIVTNASGVPLAGVTVYISSTPNASTNPATTVVTGANGTYSVGVINGTWYVCAGSTTYADSADRVIIVNSANVTNVNFGLALNPTASGQVTDTAGNPISGASVYFSLTPNASANPLYTATTTASGLYLQSVASATLYICAGASNYLTSADQLVTVTSNVANVDFAVAQNPLGNSMSGNVPQSSQLLFSVVTDPLPLTGAISNWPTYLPVGQQLTAMGATPPPTVQVVGGRKLAVNTNNESAPMGFMQGTYSSPIPCSGASIVTVVISHRNANHDPYDSIVDLLYDRLLLGIYNDTGALVFKCNGNVYTTPTNSILDGQLTVVSMVAQPNGQFAVWTNGILCYTNNTVSALTNLVPGVAGSYADTINVGNNGVDFWSDFSGNIGDVFVYTNALTSTSRQQLEQYLFTCFATNSTQTIMATAGTGGSLVPQGAVAVLAGSNQNFTITPSSYPVGWAVSNVVVDGVSKGVVSSYTFTNVTVSHTITATFYNTNTLYTITASAGSGGAISPVGGVLVIATSNQSFTITPNTGYVADVTVDGVDQGVITNYTFVNVRTNHVIAATFSQIILTVSASAGANGAISPAGSVPVIYGNNQSFTITPNTGYAAAVTVDGVALGAISSYTFTNVTANHTITATFSNLILMVTASAGTGGTINPAGGVPVAYGANQSFTITASNTYSISNVVVDSVSQGAISSYAFTNVTANHTIAAAFSAVPATAISVNYCQANDILASTNLAGVVAVNHWNAIIWDGNSGGTSYSNPTNVLYDSSGAGVSGFTVTLSAGAEYSYGSGIVPPTGGDYSASLFSDSSMNLDWSGGGAATATAAFTNIPYAQYDLYVYNAGFVSGAQVYYTIGTVSNLLVNSDIRYPLTQGSNYVRFIALTNPNPVLAVAYGAGTQYSQQGISAFQIVQDAVAYTITATAGMGGMISPSGSVLVGGGSNQSFTISPSAGYGITNVTVDGMSQGAVSSHTFTNVTATHSISATFSNIILTVTASAGAGGTINPSGSVAVGYGSNQSFTISANAGDGITNVTVDGVSQGAINSYTFTNVTANHTISATFSNISLTVTASAGTGGTISPAGSVAVGYGSNQSFTISASSGDGITNVTVDGLSQGAVSSYTFTNVTANHTIVATFSNLAVSAAGVISVNYCQANDILPTSTVAGKVPTNNWNSIINTGSNYQSPTNAFYDSSGAGVSGFNVKLSATGFNTWNTGSSGQSDADLFADWGLDISGTGTTGTVTFTNIPYAQYDLYVYLSTFSGGLANGNYIIGTMTNNLACGMGSPANFSTYGYVQGSNYVKFTGLTNQNLVMSLQVGSGYDFGIAAFQIVQAAASSQTISVNYCQANDVLPTSTVAGRVPTNNWNSILNTGSNYQSPTNAFYDSSGAGVSGFNVKLSAIGFNTWNTGSSGQSDADLFADWGLDISGAGTTGTVTFTNIPYAQYDLYVYLSTFSGGLANGNYIIGTTTNNLACGMGSPANFSTYGYVQGSNYVKFTALTNRNPVMTLQVVSGYDFGIAAFQIVQSGSGQQQFVKKLVETRNPLVGVTPPLVVSPASLTLPGGMRTFAIPNTLARYQYTLVYKNQLTDPTWTPLTGLGSAAGNNGTLELSDTNSINSPAQRFYRIQIQ